MIDPDAPRLGFGQRILAGYRRRHLALQQALTGPLGTPIDVERIPESVVPWRRRGAFGPMPASGVVVFGSLVAVAVGDTLMLVLRALNAELVYAFFAFVVTISLPLLSILPAVIKIKATLHLTHTYDEGSVIFVYFCMDFLIFLFLCVCVVAAMIVEFCLNARAITAIAFESARRIVGTIFYSLLASTAGFLASFYALFFTELLGFYIHAFDVHFPKTMVTAYMFVLSVQIVGLMCVTGFLITWATALVSLAEAVGRSLRTKAG